MGRQRFAVDRGTGGWTAGLPGWRYGSGREGGGRGR